MIFNSNKYETLVSRRLTYIWFWICSQLSQVAKKKCLLSYAILLLFFAVLK